MAGSDTPPTTHVLTSLKVVHDVFSYGYHTGMTFQASQWGPTNGQFSDINFDDVDVGLDVYDTQDNGVMFTNLNLVCLT